MLLGTLACVLGVHTVVLAAAPNDNGLLHQELVDYELPRGLGWPGLEQQGGAATNPLDMCWDLLPFVAADGAAGAAALDRRHRTPGFTWT